MQEEAERVVAEEVTRKAVEEVARLAQELEKKKAAYVVQLSEKGWKEPVGGLRLGACQNCMSWKLVCIRPV